MNEQTNSVIIEFLDTESKFRYLNYYYSKMLDETNDEEYVYMNGGIKKNQCLIITKSIIQLLIRILILMMIIPNIMRSK